MAPIIIMGFVELGYASIVVAQETTQIPTSWILAGALIVLLISMIYNQILGLFKKKKKKK